MDFTPNEAMVAAATRALSLSIDTDTIEPLAKATASLIAEGGTLTASHVQHMASFFLAHKLDREPGWELTDAGLAHLLWGGDAGKAWTAAKSKEIALSEVALSESKVDFAELFFEGETDLDLADVKAGPDGLIWKPMLPVGVWKVGPNGRPLRVVAGKSPDQRHAIGMQDVMDAFNADAVPHVTIPLSHEDKTDENTGYIRKLKIGLHNGVQTLFGGHDFTDKRTKGKVVDGSIANTSVGLEFDYVRKDDGKKFPVILRHNALTNKPWLGRKLAPFGLGEEQADNFMVMCGEYSKQLTAEDQAAEEVATPEIDDKSTSGTGDTIQTSEVVDATTTKEPVMGAENKKENEMPATPAPTVDLSEHPDFIAEREKNARLAAQFAQLAEKDRRREADDFVKTLKDMGFTEEKGCTGFLKKTRAILLSDTEGDTALLLSEDDAAPRSLSASEIVKELLLALPSKDGVSAVAAQLSEQQADPLSTSRDGAGKPPVEDETDLANMSEEQKIAAADAWFESAFPNSAKNSTSKEN